VAKKVTGPLTAGLFRKPAFWLLFTIVFLGGCFRFYNPDWDYQHSFHPDERNILGQTAGIQSENGYRVSFWAYGQLTIYLYRATGELLSTPSFFYNLFRGNEGTAQTFYWLLLAFTLSLLFLFVSKEKGRIVVFALPFLSFSIYALLGGGTSLFSKILPALGFSLLFMSVLGACFFVLPLLKERSGISDFALCAFIFANFAFWSLCPLFSNQGFSTINFVLWLLLLGFLYFLYRLFLDENNDTLEVVVATLLFVGFLVYKFFPIFCIWLKAVEDGPAKIICFALVTVVSFGLSFIAAEFFEIEWEGIPFYSAAGFTAFLGVLPFILPVVLAQTFGALAFTILVSATLLWWALASRWGRGCVSLLGFWVCLATLTHAGKQYTGYGECMIIGRLWAAAFSTATIFAVFILVKRIYQNISMAFLAAAFFAFSVVSIEQTHYCISESFITFMFVVVAICSYEIIREGTWRSYLLAGGAFGLALAAKTSSLYYVFVLVTAHLVSLSQKSAKDWEKEDKKLGDNRTLFSVLAVLLLALTVIAFGGVGYKFHGVLQDLFEKEQMVANGIWAILFAFLAGLGIMFASWGAMEFKVFRAQMPQWLKLVGAGGLAFLLFCLLSPWSLLDIQKFMESQNYEWHTVSIADACYVLQFKDTPRYIYQLKNLMSVELWWPLGVTVVLGMIWVLGRFVLRLVRPVTKGYLLLLPFNRNKGFAFSLPDLLILCWFIPYFGFIGSWNTKFVRYMVPLIPAFCIFGARFLTDLFEWGKKISLGKFLKPILCTLVIGPSLFYSIAYMHVYRFQHPWVESSVWMYKNIPFGSKIFNESWGDGLPVDVSPEQDNRVDRIMSPSLYHSQDVTPYEMHGFPTDNSPVKKNYYANLIPQGEYISISSKKLWYTLTDATSEFRPNGFNIYPVTSRYYRCLWSGLLGYKMVAEFHNFPSFLGWEHPDDMAEESFSVYDHPRIYIFKKFETVTPEKILKLLETDDYVKGINRDQMRNVTPASVDSFIAERHQYLESRGLLASLDEVVPTPVSTTGVAPVSEEKQLQPTPVPTVPAQTQPTPEIKLDVPPTVPQPPNAKTLQVLQSYADHPVIENDPTHPSPVVEEGAGYQFWAWFIWLGAFILLGWLALPLTLRVLAPMPGGGYSLSKVLGFFIFAWLVWFTTSLKVCHFTIGSCWFWFFALTILSLFGFWRDRQSIKALYSKWSKAWLIQEGAFVLAFLIFTIIKIFIPHIHDPVGDGYHGGGEAGMDFGFMASVVRGESFPPQNMWMAGLPISYSFYYGHLMMGILTKFLGLVPAVTYNLALISLFALNFSCAFGLAYALSGRLVSGWIAGFLCAAAGNPAGARQVFEGFHQSFMSGHLSVLFNSLFNYDDWGPTRVIPNSINEFPYFSVLYGDLHAHTLAMPFAMLLIAMIGSYYMSKSTQPFDWKKDRLNLLSMGFLLGGIAYLNSWEIPTWLIFIGMTLLIRSVGGFGEKILQKGFGTILGSLILCLTLLGWVATFIPGLDPQVLGGKTPLLVGAVLLSLILSGVFLFIQKSTKAFAKHLISIGITLVGILFATFLLWLPFFLQFNPQQSQILWVTPNLRTNLGDFFGIYGLILTVLVLSFVVGGYRNLLEWLGREKKEKWDLDLLLDKAVSTMEQVILPRHSIRGMLFLGVVTMFLIWGASWVHWTFPPDKTLFSLLIATVAAVLVSLAVYRRDTWGLWLAVFSFGLFWMALLVMHFIHLFQDMSLSLGMPLFSVLWLLAFLHLGLGLRTFKDRALSFSYLMVSLFFFILATLEIFVMREYLGGDYLRNNSLFKFGINAWELGAITVGVFLPKIFDLFALLFKTVKNESGSSRRGMTLVSAFFLFVFFHVILDSFLSSFSNTVVSVLNVLFIGSILGWSLIENWIKNSAVKLVAIGVGILLILFSILPMLPGAPYGTILALAQRWTEDFNAGILFPALLALLVVGIFLILWERKKNTGRTLIFLSWRALLIAFGLMVLIYPIAATIRKCHGFFAAYRQQWTGSVENLTLNGLAYISRVNPYDAAAIRFLNEHIPDQPCLVEFVGEGYNSWGSRFSIFTGIPALMGWDGHVHEWVTGRPVLGEDVDRRFQATEQIFRTPDPQLAKKYLDAYGVRLVMVGTVERNGVPGRKGGYPPDGLAKFSSFLPLIYRNPQVEIYYNPPPASN
jgi:YYY domain-containing protein